MMRLLLKYLSAVCGSINSVRNSIPDSIPIRDSIDSVSFPSAGYGLRAQPRCHPDDPHRLIVSFHTAFNLLLAATLI
jgi:hypothetical protein